MKWMGQYPKDVKLALIASAISGHHCIFVSEPGYGKTEMAHQAAKAVAGEDGRLMIPIDPSTPPEAIRGAWNPASMLQGKLERVVDGTPYDPTIKVVILDEIWRANDVCFDALIHVTGRKDIDQTTRPVFWGTANFVGKQDRTAALRDRFAIWMWLNPALPAGLVESHLNNGEKNTQ